MSEQKPLVKLLPDLIAQAFHLPIQTGKVRITEDQAHASCRWVEIKMKQSVPSFCFSIDQSRKKGENEPIFPFLTQKKRAFAVKMMPFWFVRRTNKFMFF